MPSRLSRALRLFEQKNRRSKRRPRQLRLGVETLEDRVVPSSLARFIDDDGDRYTVRVGGPGQAVVQLAESDGASSISQILLQGTHPLRSALTVSVAKARTGDGYVDIGSITGDGVRFISAPRGNLTNAGLTLNDRLQTLRIGNVRADITLPSLRAMTVYGAVEGSTIQLGGTLSGFVAKLFHDSQLYVGFTPGNPAQPMLGGSFAENGYVRSFKATGKLGSTAPAFSNSVVAAVQGGVFSLRSVAEDNGGTMFGIAVKDSVRAVAVTSPRFRLNPRLPLPQGIDDFQVIKAPTGPVQLIAALTNDTGPSSSDGFTSDPIISGTLTTANTLVSFQAGFNGDLVDVLADLLPDGNFHFDRERLEETLGSELIDGLYTLHLQALDDQDNLAEVDVAFALDTQRPTVVVNTPPADFRTNQNITVTGSVTIGTTPPASVQGQIDSGPLFNVAFDQAGNFTFNTSFLLNGSGDGAHSVTVRAADAAGNAADPLTVNFVLDTIDPAAPTFNLSIASDTGTVGDDQTEAGRVTLTGIAEPGAVVTLVQTGAVALASNTGAFTLPNVDLALGDNPLTIRASDAAGNTSPDTNRTITRVNPTGQPDPVLFWNMQALEAIKLDADTPPEATRGLAILHSAILDAVNAIEDTPGLYVSLTTPAGTSVNAAITAAAHRVLSYLYPAQQESFDTQRALRLAEIADGPGKTNGIALGEAVADALIALREDDGYDAFAEHLPSTAPGDWQPTPPLYAVPLLPHWGSVQPFIIPNTAQFYPDGPPSLDSQEWAAAFNEVKLIGADDSTTRTAEQTDIARFWADGLGTYTPPGHWNQIAGIVAAAEGNSPADNARLFAQLNVALADTAILTWDVKYLTDFWRPVTAIRNADTDGNDQTAPDLGWSSFIVTPNFPEYVSGHSTFSGAAAAILTNFFGDNVGFTVGSHTPADLVRSFTSFEEAAHEASLSRVYGGIHYRFSSEGGYAIGHELGEYVLSAFSVAADTQAPAIVLEPAPVVSAANFDIKGQILDNLAGLQQASVQINNGAVVPLSLDAQGRFTLNTAQSTDGVYTFRFTAVDAAGNTSTRDLVYSRDTTAPDIDVLAPENLEELDDGSRLFGFVDGTGSSVARLTYAFDGGTPMPFIFGPAGEFDVQLNLATLGVGQHDLVVTATDAAGNTATQTIQVTLAELAHFGVAGITPADGGNNISVTYRPQVFFSRAVNVATLNGTNFFATDSTGEQIPTIIVPGADGAFAWLFFPNPLPSAETITIHVDGATIRAAADNAVLDADWDGEPGGELTWSFTTVSLAAVPGTTLRGILADPGPDLHPGTFDDVRPGPDGVLTTEDDIYLNPIAGAKIFIIGLEDQAVFTGPDGYFELNDIPAGNIKLVIDGLTATNAPSGIYFPEMVMDLNVFPGVVNTVMQAMEPEPERIADIRDLGVYLPRLETSILQAVSGTEKTFVGVSPEAAPDLTAEERQFLTLEVQPGSVLGPDGQPLANPLIGISAVPPELVREMLPPGLLQHTFDITIQAPEAAVFNTPLQITFPNVFNAAPGTKLDFLSFDHTTGRLVIEGTATVSEDGLYVVTDPGTGVTKPGWHGVTPPGGCGGSGGPPTLGPVDVEPGENVVENNPVGLDFIIGDAGVTNWVAGVEGTSLFTAPTKNDNVPELPQIAGCEVPPLRKEEQQPFKNVTIEVDGFLADFMKKSGDLPLVSQSFTLSPGSEDKTFNFATLPYEMIPQISAKGGFTKLERDMLFGAKIKITVIEQFGDGSRKRTISTFYLNRWVDAIDARFAQTKTGNTAAFMKTLTDGVVREKNVDVFLPSTVPTSFSGPFITPFDLGGPVSGPRTAVWKFDPLVDGQFRTDNFSIQVQDPKGLVTVGNITAVGTAIHPTTININLEGYKAELREVILALKNVMVPVKGGPGSPLGIDERGIDDDHNGIVNDNAEYGFPGSDDRVEVVYDYGGAVVTAQTVGPDRILNTPDDVTRDVIDFEFGGGWRIRGGKTYARFQIVSPAFRELIAGYLPSDRELPGDDGVLGTNDDEFSPQQLRDLDDFLLEDMADDLFDAIKADYDPINSLATGYTFVNVGGDVTMVWEDRFSGRTGAPVFGSASFDADTQQSTLGDRNGDGFTLEALFTNAVLPIGAKMWGLAENLNFSKANSGGFGVAIHMMFNPAPVAAPLLPTTFAQYVANTVSHEVGHTFGLKDAYTNDGMVGGDAQADANGNTIPFDIMMAGSPQDPDLTFLPQNTILLQAAMGMHANGDNVLKDAVDQYRKTINLPASVNGVRPLAGGGIGEDDDDGMYVEFGEVPNTEIIRRNIAVQRGDSAFFGVGEESDYLGAITADGAGGQVLTADYTVINAGSAPLTISDVRFANGTRGLTYVDAGLIGGSLSVGETALVRVQFDPSVVGDATDSLIIVSDASLAPTLTLPITATGTANVPTASLTISQNNNFGGVPVGASVQRVDFATITNDGFQSLLISGVRFATDTEAFQLLGIPADIGANPITLATGDSFSFGLQFDPSSVGLHRAKIEVLSNDPNQPTLTLGAVGTGLDQVVYPDWGKDFVAVNVGPDDSGVPIRAVSSETGQFSMFLRSATPYHITMFDPVTGLVAHGYGVTAPAGGNTELTTGLVFAASSAPDTDYDGLPDDIEHAIGSSLRLQDTDRDGVDDFTEIAQGLESRGGAAVPTGLVATARLRGESMEVVLEGSTLNGAQQTAFVATGSFGLGIVNASQFNRPVVLAQLDLAGDATDVAVDSAIGIAAVAANAGGLHIVDVSQLTAPKLLQTIAINAAQVEVVDGVAYANDGTELHGYDLLSGNLLQSLPLSGLVRGLAVENGFLYALAGQDLQVIELSADTMIPRGSAAVPQTSSGKLFVGGGIAYVPISASGQAGATGGFATVNVANTDAPVLLSGVDDTSLMDAAIAANGSGLALIVGSLSGAGGEVRAADLVDVRDPANTANLVTRFNLPSEPFGVAIGAGIAYVAGGTGGLQVVNYRTFDVDGLPPTVSITSSADDLDGGAPGVQVTEGQTLPIQLTVTDDVQVRNVELLVNGQVVRNDVSFPFELSALATRSDPLATTVSVQARATDTGGNAALSNVLVFDLIPDTIAPFIEQVTQVEGVGGLTIIRIRANEALAAATITTANVQVQDSTGAAVAPRSIGLQRNDREIVLTIGSLTGFGHRLFINAAAVTDRAGNPLAGFDPPEIVGAVPVSGALVGVTDTIRIDFSEPIQGASFVADNFVVRDSSGAAVPVAAVVGLNGDQSVELQLAAPLVDGAYRVEVRGAGLLDADNQPLGVGITIATSFDVETTGPTIVRLDPADGAVKDQDFRVIEVEFSEPMDVADLTAQNLQLLGPNSQIVAPLNIEILDGDRLVKLTYDFLTPGAYQFTINAPAVSDRFNNAVGAVPIVSNFTLINEPAGIFPGQVFLTGNSPKDFVLGDFNNDGLQDVATANEGGQSVSILLGKRNGALQTALDTALGDLAPSRLAAVHLNADGNLDLVAMARDNATFDDVLAILLGDGTGQFTVSQVIVVPQARDIAVGDVTGDDILDLVTVSSALDGSISIFVGLGNASFAAPVYYAAAGLPSAVALDDLDGDNDLDIVAVSEDGFDSNAVVLLNPGDGEFPGKLTVTPGELIALVHGDFNDDGELDLATLVEADDGTNVAVHLGSGAGEYEDPIIVELGFVEPIAMASADVDDDGIPDLVAVGVDDDDNTLVFTILGDGGGNFAVTATATIPDTFANVLVVADINGDNDLDVLLGTDDFNQELLILAGDGSGTFGAAVPIAVGFEVAGLAVGELTGDSNVDIVVANFFGDTAVLTNSGVGGFAVGTVFDGGDGDSVLDLRLAHVDGDTNLDLITAVDDIGAFFFAGNGDGTFDPHVVLDAGVGFEELHLADIDGDSDLDIVAATSDETVGHMLNDGAGVFGNFVVAFTNEGDISTLALADFTGDTEIDIAAGILFGQRLRVLAGDGAGTFSDAAGTADLYPVTGAAVDVAIADIDDDGILDLVALSDDFFSSATVSVLLGLGGGVFDAEIVSAAGESATRFDVGDVTGDGHPDIVIAGSVNLLPGLGNGQFDPLVELSDSDGTAAVAIHDFDGNGVQDIAVLNQFDSQIQSIPASGGSLVESYAVDFGPATMAKGDLNGDLHADVVTANSAGTVSVLLTDGNGSFQVSTLNALANNSDVVLADLDDDGNLDIVVAGTSVSGAGAIGVLFGNGAGGFAGFVEFAVGGFVHRLTAGDVTGDGRPDVIAADGGLFFVLETDTDGSLRPPVAYRVPGLITDLTLLDVDGDTDLDVLATANTAAGTGEVVIVPNLGAGVFPNRASLSPGTPTQVVVADMNDDTIPDLVTISVESSFFAGEGFVSVYLGQGDGTYAAANSLSLGNKLPSSLAVADVDGDSMPDVVITTFTFGFPGQSELLFLAGNGDGTLDAPLATAVSGELAALALGDLDGDDELDAIVADVAQSKVYRLLGAGDGNFSAAEEISAVAATDLALGFLNDDAVLDLVSVSGGALQRALGNGDGTFGTPVDMVVGGLAQFLELGDVNGDGELDLVVADATQAPGNIAVLLGDGAGNFAAPVSTTFDNPGFISTFAFALGHVDGDALVDAVGMADGRLLVFLSAGDGSFDVTESAAGTTALNIVLADLDDDGTTDLAVTSSDPNLVLASPGDGVGGFAAFSDLDSLTTGVFAETLITGDVNGDGIPDIVAVDVGSGGAGPGGVGGGGGGVGGIGGGIGGGVGVGGLAALALGGSGPSRVAVFLSNGDGTFEPPQFIDSGAGTQSVALGDVDGDGFVDIVTANSGSGTAAVLLGNGDGTFRERTEYKAGDAAVLLEDVDGDGDLDLIALDDDDAEIDVLPNNTQ